MPRATATQPAAEVGAVAHPPWSSPTSPLADVSTTGVLGPELTTTKELELEAGPVLPAASVAWAVTV